jgi:DNA repair protein RadA
LHQNTIIKTLKQKQLLSLNNQNVNQLFPGFTSGDFAVLYGSQSVLSLSSLLCVRAQLPTQLGGLGSRVVFVDGGNSFKLYQIARLARLHNLNPEKILKKIHIARAFTAYQITSLILEKLKETVNKYNAKLVIISDILRYYCDNDIDPEESYQIYKQVLSHLSRFANENDVILIVTEKHQDESLHELTVQKADTVIQINQSKYEQEFILEKHAKYVLGTADFSPESLEITHFSQPAQSTLKAFIK